MQNANSISYSRLEYRSGRFRGIAVLALATLAAIAVCTGCRPAPGSPQAAAEAFLDAHYVRIDLPSSLQKTDGPAAQKVREEIRLTEGLDAPEEQHKPRIHYTLSRQRPSGDETTFVYQLTISPMGSEPFTRDVILTVRDRGAGFRVTNYLEK